MKLPPKQRRSSLAVVGALSAVLIVLGVLQYRWSREVSEAASVRMQTSLHTALLSWRQDLYRELASASDAFQYAQPSNAKENYAEVVQRYRNWSRVAAHPQLVENVFLLRAGDAAGSRLLHLDQATGEFETAEWPNGFERLRGWLERRSSEINRRPRPPGPPRDPERQKEHGHGRPGPVWSAVAQDVPALVYPVFRRDASAPNKRAGVDWFIVQLNTAVLREHVFPELAERYFGGNSGLTYRVAVLSEGREQGVIYSSDADFGAQDMASADANINIFGLPLGGGGPRVNIVLPPLPPPRPEHLARFLHAAGGSPFFLFEPIRYDSPAPDWRLVVRNRGGSLEAVAAAIRRRNLAISFGVLLVLAATVGMILIASQRAQRLAKLQMEFVAAVSHELRTPLTVISSAADNIADGVVENKQQVVQYGKVIKGQARQLIELVEQVLLFAATNDGGYRYHMQLLPVDEIVDAALESTAGLVSAAGFSVEKELEAGLPQVEGDLGALSQCLQNLITNAVKYGGEQRWIAVRARRDGAEGRDEVQISVADRGHGIERAELEQIFQPFYRSPAATAAQIHGTGLGLPLAKSIAKAMNGRLTVSSKPGQGSTFVLHLPVAAASALPTPQAAAAGAKLS